MIISLKAWRRRIRYMILFIVLVYFIFHVTQLIYEWLDPFDSEDKPSGHAVKVFEQLHEGDGRVIFKDRLLFFFWYGE
ncbi:hypothetical protein PRECH8_01130 [Insulibacter thermoxylanivorax]|uniref:DUF4227 family protein n=1 Tax=Insulibacter thermoxylanivorax TaxID=2749268 RepID=A0A916VE35_9BACL|nr:DUF4227 family protein [Insulibacter thermoxylanivorax]GFR36817.1 hypothetical protein PRECH8_01130 [Insulibacter thermoxylanivorax]